MNSPAPVVPPEVNDELLRRAWRLLRPPCWPETYEASMCDPLRAQLVQMYARQLLRSDAKTNARAVWPATALATPAPARERRWPAPAAVTHGVDRKRAAAGDRDDD